MKKIIMAMAMLAMVSACKQKQKENKANETPKISTRAELLQTLKKMQTEKKIMFGQHDATLYGLTWRDERGRSDAKDVCGDYPAVIGFDLGGLEVGDAKSLDSVPFTSNRNAIIDQYNRGGIVELSWHLRNPVTGGTSWDATCDTVVKSILEGGSNHQKFLTWLDRISDFMLTLKTDSCAQIPVIFRPWHEHTGSWFWWGQNLCSDDEYKALWKLTKKHMDEKGLKNLVYAYSPNLGATAETYLQRYPGDDVIDLLGFDIYQFPQKNDKGEVVDNGSKAYMTETPKCLEFLVEYGKQHNKPIAFTETGSEGLPVENWFMNVLYPSIKDYPIAYVLVWRNADDKPGHYFTPYPGHPCEKDFVDFCKLPQIYFLKDLVNSEK